MNEYRANKKIIVQKNMRNVVLRYLHALPFGSSFPYAFSE